MRGSYRSAFESLADDRDYQNLTPLAQAVFWTLKLKLGQYGIGVFYLATLPEVHRRASRKKIDAAIAELEAAKPSAVLGWIRREHNVVWIVNGLRFEPSITLENANHRTGALRFARTLPSGRIVADFIAYYGLENRETMGSAWDGDGIPHPTGIPGGITEKETETGTERETETESSPSALIAPAEAAIAAVLPSDADRAALTALLHLVPSPATWLAEMAASLNGMGGHAPLSRAQLGLALRDFMGNGAAEKPSLGHFRGYLRNAGKPPRSATGSSLRRSPVRPPPSQYAAGFEVKKP